MSKKFNLSAPQSVSIIFSVLFSVLLFISPIQIYANAPSSINICNFLLGNLEESQISSLRSDFKFDKICKYEVPATPICDQKKYGACWAYGSLSKVEREIEKTAGKFIKLSEQFVIRKSLEYKIEDALNSSGALVTQGGWMGSVDVIIDEYGLMPKESYIPRIDFENDPHQKRFWALLNNRIANFHIQKNALGVNYEAQTALREKAYQDIQKLIASYLGEPPEKFMYDGAEYTAKTFADKFSPGHGNRITVYKMKHPGSPTINPIIEPPPPKYTHRPKLAPVEIEADLLEKVLIKNLSQGKSVLLSYEHNTAYLDKDTGIYTLSGFYIPEGFEPPSAAIREQFGFQGGGHLVEIVGVNVDADGNLVWVKIKNSWGKEIGDKGYFYMTRDYLRAYSNFFQMAGQ